MCKGVKRHISTEHEGKRFPCTYEGCGETFSRLFDAKRHAKKNTI